jgi:16S rRNA (guanine527-N7)-methyltransferase
MKSLELIEAQAVEWGVRLGEKQLDGLLRYGRLLASYDRANVIGTRDLQRIMLDHVLDSLSCFLHEPLWEADRIADVGSGGGLPGIPVSLVRREVRNTLMESTGKKANFLRLAAEDLTLENVSVANARVEDLGGEREHRGAYEVVTSRAVARLSVLAEYCVPLLEIGGKAIAMKGRLQRQELEEGARAANVLGAKVVRVEWVEMIPGVGDKERNLVIIQKVGETPARYPRKAGTVAKKPLGGG